MIILVEILYIEGENLFIVYIQERPLSFFRSLYESVILSIENAAWTLTKIRVHAALYFCGR